MTSDSIVYMLLLLLTFVRDVTSSLYLESKRKRFKPWENLRRMFQRKNSTASEHQPASKGQSSSSSRLGGVFGLAGSSRSRSTSELLTTEPQPIPVNR